MNTLFKEFDAVNKADWLAKVEKDLKGKPLASLDWKLTEELVITPLTHQEDLSTPPSPIVQEQENNNWEIGVLLDATNPKLANQLALQALETGATAIGFWIPRSLQLEEIEILLKEVQLEWISTHFLIEKSTWKRFLKNYISFVKNAGFDTAKIQTTFSLKGNVLDTVEEKKVLKELKEILPTAKFLTINGQRFYKGKESTAKELANILKAGNDLLIELQQQQLDLADFSQALQFSITLGDSYFINIAKVRAIKLLWSQLLAAWDESLSSLPTIQVHLGLKSQDASENYNKIKATAQALSAVIAGVQRLYIYPSDETAEQAGSDFARRIAWNIQHLLQLESYMDRVKDPAAGSYYIESLTDQLADAAWTHFQRNV